MENFFQNVCPNSEINLCGSCSYYIYECLEHGGSISQTERHNYVVEVTKSGSNGRDILILWKHWNKKEETGREIMSPRRASCGFISLIKMAIKVLFRIRTKAQIFSGTKSVPFHSHTASKPAASAQARAFSRWKPRVSTLWESEERHTFPPRANSSFKSESDG